MTLQLNTLAGKRVLIAEDEPMIAMDHAALLVRAGAEIVGTCATVRGAVDCVGEMAIYVAVIHFMLADGNSQPPQAALNRKQITFVVATAYDTDITTTVSLSSAPHVAARAVRMRAERDFDPVFLMIPARWLSTVR